MGKISREDLFREIGEIDEAYVEEARLAGRKRPAFSPVAGVLVAAASLVLCVGVGYMTFLFSQPGEGTNAGGAPDAGGGAMQAAEECYSMAQDMGEQPQDAVSVREEAAEEEASPEAGPMAGAKEEASPEAGPVAGAKEEVSPEAGPVAGAEGEVLQEAGAEAGMAAGDETSLPRQEMASDRQMQKEDSRQCNAVSDTGSQAASSGGAVQEKDLAESASEKKGSLADVEKGMEELLEAGAVKLTWEEARKDGTYGRYVDVQAPEGYEFGGAVRSESSLYVSWNSGMAYIAIACRQADEGVSDWLADVEKPEEYDLRLYTVPWCDSVPRELYTVLANATFRPEQVTPEILAARTYESAGQDQTAGTRTAINLLYDDNILVEISAGGSDAEEIYALINLENQ